MSRLEIKARGNRGFQREGELASQPSDDKKIARAVEKRTEETIGSLNLVA